MSCELGSKYRLVKFCKIARVRSHMETMEGFSHIADAGIKRPGLRHSDNYASFPSLLLTPESVHPAPFCMVKHVRCIRYNPIIID